MQASLVAWLGCEDRDISFSLYPLGLLYRNAYGLTIKFRVGNAKCNDRADEASLTYVERQ